MNPNRIVPLLIAAVLNVATLLGQQKLSREEYIRRYKGLAVEEMDIYGIPASIKMAQALLESDNGNGRTTTRRANAFASTPPSKTPIATTPSFWTVPNAIRTCSSSTRWTIKDGPTGSSRPAMRPIPNTPNC